MRQSIEENVGHSLVKWAAARYVPAVDSRRAARGEEIFTSDGYERVTPEQTIKLAPGYYARLAVKIAAAIAGLTLAGFMLYLILGYMH